MQGVLINFLATGEALKERNGIFSSLCFINSLPSQNLNVCKHA